VFAYLSVCVYIGQQAVAVVNDALEANDEAATLRALHNPALQLPAVIEHSAAADRFYHQQLRSIRLEKQVCLSPCCNNLHGKVLVWLWKRLENSGSGIEKFLIPGSRFGIRLGLQIGRHFDIPSRLISCILCSIGLYGSYVRTVESDSDSVKIQITMCNTE